MDNHVHLVVDPGKESDSLGQLMKWVSGNHAMRINRTSGRRGALWEGRYLSSIIATDRYLLACCRYVESNPVRAGIVDSPGKFRWSSYRRRAGLEWNDWLDHDPAYKALGRNTKTRQCRYREWMLHSVSDDRNALMRESLRKGHVTGTRGCVERIYQLTGRWLGPKRRGRPPQRKMGTVPN
jgi:putative transposase